MGQRIIHGMGTSSLKKAPICLFLLTFGFRDLAIHEFGLTENQFPPMGFVFSFQFSASLSYEET